MYSNSGHVRQVFDARAPISAGILLQHVHRMNARGDVIEATTSNGTLAQRMHDPATGATLFAIDRLPDGRYATFYEYQWDDIGNLVRRTNLADGIGIEEEHFFYDEGTGRRLMSAWRSNGNGSAAPHPIHGGDGWSLSDSLSYDLSGNIRCKRGGASTHCGSGGANTHEYERANGAGPHAVTEANLAGHGPISFDYDDNGNMTSRSGSGAGPDHSFHYSAASQLEVICGTGVGCTFIAYGSDRQRVAKWEYEGSGSSASLLKLTHYVNGLEFEYSMPEPTSTTDAQTIRRPVAGGGLELLERFGTAVLARMQVLHSDHLGSIVAVSDANGQIEARMAFDAWGQRRDPWSDAAWLQWTDLRPVWADAMLAITPRGFTGHEHLDRHGLIHMNGRVYDPRLGRFLQADPFIEDTSTLNRYTYVLNNPLSYSDPSGYFSFKDFARLAFSVTLSFYTQTWVTQLAELGNYAGAIGTVAASGAVAGVVNSGTWDGALSGAFTAVASFGIGQGLEAGRFAGNFMGSELNPAGFALKIGAHGVVGGVAAELQGGKFGHGFLSSGVTAAFSPAIHNPDGNTLMQTALAAMIGGTVSEISGGSFANGAVTAAMQFALNQMSEIATKDGGEVELAVSSENPETGFGSMDEASLAQYQVYDGLYREVSARGNELWGGILRKDGRFYFSDMVETPARYSAGFNAPDGYRIGGVTHTHPAGGSGFSGLDYKVPAGGVPFFVRVPDGNVYRWNQAEAARYERRLQSLQRSSVAPRSTYQELIPRSRGGYYSICPGGDPCI